MPTGRHGGHQNSERREVHKYGLLAIIILAALGGRTDATSHQTDQFPEQLRLLWGMGLSLRNAGEQGNNSCPARSKVKGCGVYQ